MCMSASVAPNLSLNLRMHTRLAVAALRFRPHCLAATYCPAVAAAPDPAGDWMSTSDEALCDACPPLRRPHVFPGRVQSLDGCCCVAEAAAQDAHSSSSKLSGGAIGGESPQASFSISLLCNPPTDMFQLPTCVSGHQYAPS